MIQKGDVAYVVSTVVGGVDTFFQGMNGVNPHFVDVVAESMFMEEDEAYMLADLLNSKLNTRFDVIEIEFE